MSIVSLLVIVLVACVVLWAVTRLLTAFSVGEPVSTVVYILVVLLVLVWVVQSLTGGSFARGLHL